jgi:XTP/dITP diphosphohydrolase
LYDVYFVSSNRNKYKEVKSILQNFGIKVGFLNMDLEEIQSNSLERIAYNKIKNAFTKCKKPVIIEDDGFFIDALNGFPGPFSSFAFKTIGNDGILRLVRANRKASFQSIIAYCDKNTSVKIFKARVLGRVSTRKHGKGWGYDPIFIPSGKNKTYAQLYYKNELSHRYGALKKFANWFVYKQKSTDR